MDEWMCFVVYLLGHVVNAVLVAEPIAALDRVIEVVLPLVVVHVSESGVDAALSGHRVRTRRKELRNDGRLEAGVRQAVRCAQTGATRANHHRIVRVINKAVVGFLFFCCLFNKLTIAIFD